MRLGANMKAQGEKVVTAAIRAVSMRKRIIDG
jgi:hypothetical protein